MASGIQACAYVARWYWIRFDFVDIFDDHRLCIAHFRDNVDLENGQEHAKIETRSADYQEELVPLCAQLGHAIHRCACASGQSCPSFRSSRKFYECGPSVNLIIY